MSIKLFLYIIAEALTHIEENSNNKAVFIIANYIWRIVLAVNI